MIFTARDKTLDCSARPLIMGILNVTPDSFSENGANYQPDVAVANARRMIEQGADLIDIGGESSRPGADTVAAAEEQARVIPVICELRKSTDVLISIDTYKASTAAAAIAAGADIINDISGFHRDPAMKQVAAETGAGCIAMHMRGNSQTMQGLTDYADIIEEVASYFQETIAMLTTAGVKNSAIMLDPGIGFAKTVAQNLLLLRGLRQFQRLNHPLLIGTSRKSFIGRTLQLDDPTDRIWGTAATMAWSVACGAQVLRVHDIAEMRQVCDMTAAITGAQP